MQAAVTQHTQFGYTSKGWTNKVGPIPWEKLKISQPAYQWTENAVAVFQQYEYFPIHYLFTLDVL